MTDLMHMIAARLSSGLLQACEDMIVPPGSPPAGDAVETAASVMQAGLPASGELLPLAATAVVFIAAVAIIIVRAQIAWGTKQFRAPIMILGADTA